MNEFEVGVPHARLLPYVASYVGYRVEGIAPGVHIGLPSSALTFIISLDEPVDVEHCGPDGRVRRDYGAFVAGLSSAPAWVRHGGRQVGVQIDLAPLGALALFGVPAKELVEDVVHLADLVPLEASELVERLSAAASWRARWRVLDELFLRWLRDPGRQAPRMADAWSLLIRSRGRLEVHELASKLDMSRRQLSHNFKATFGLSPKRMARVIRFERAQQLLRQPRRPSLAMVADVCGYADQAHMTREWNEFSGMSPTAWLSDPLLLPNLQDDA